MTELLRNRISILSQLANIDGDFDIRELAFIYNVCLRNNVDVDAIGDIISEPEPVIALETLTFEEQAVYLTDILLMMMIDGKVLPREVSFCLEIGTRLGFDPDAIHAFIVTLQGQKIVNAGYVGDGVHRLLRIQRIGTSGMQQERCKNDSPV